MISGTGDVISPEHDAVGDRLRRSVCARSGAGVARMYRSRRARHRRARARDRSRHLRIHEPGAYHRGARHRRLSNGRDTRQEAVRAAPMTHNDAERNRPRAGQAHRGAGRCQARGGDRAAQPLATHAARRGDACGNHAQEHPDDRTDGGGEDRDRPPPGPSGGSSVHQGRGDQVHRGRLRRAATSSPSFATSPTSR